MNPREAEIRRYTQNGHSVREFDSNSEFNRLSCELNQRLSQEMSDYMSSVSSQIQRDIIKAINDQQILPKVQATLGTGQGQIPERRCKTPARRQGFSSEEAIDRRFRSSSRDECNRDSTRNEVLNTTNDMVTGDNEYPTLIPELFTRKHQSLTVLDKPNCINNDLLDTTLSAPEQTPSVTVQDPINRLADVLTSMQSLPTAQQQLTIRLVN